MSNEMIERVAKAIHRKQLLKKYHPSRSDVIDREIDTYWHLYAEEAKAAIQAMRDPNKEMLDAGIYASENNNRDVYLAYVNMIDAALKE